MRALKSLLIATLTGPLAHAGGGAGGALVDGLIWPRYGDPDGDHTAPGLIGCLGGLGYGVLDSGLRLGAEGAACRGHDGIRATQGGVQIGWRPPVEGAYITAFGTVGLGSFADDTAPSGPYRSFYGHLTPQAGVGWAVYGSTVEATVGLRVPVQLAQWITSDATPRGFITPTPIARVALMWGRVGRNEPRDQGPGWRPENATPTEPADRPLAQPGPPGEPEAPPPDTAPSGDTPPEDPPPETEDPGDRPLAIPVGDGG